MTPNQLEVFKRSLAGMSEAELDAMRGESEQKDQLINELLAPGKWPNTLKNKARMLDFLLHSHCYPSGFCGDQLQKCKEEFALERGAYQPNHKDYWDITTKAMRACHWIEGDEQSGIEPKA